MHYLCGKRICYEKDFSFRKKNIEKYVDILILCVIVVIEQNDVDVFWT